MLEWLDEPDSMMKESLNRPKSITIEKFDDYHKQVLQIVKNLELEINENLKIKRNENTGMNLFGNRLFKKFNKT